MRRRRSRLRKISNLPPCAARNFNLPAATCGKICVAEVEEIVPVGSLDPDCIHLPSIYVNRLILGAPYDKKIEFRTVRERELA